VSAPPAPAAEPRARPPRRLEAAVALSVAATLVTAALLLPPAALGDAGEYLLMIEALRAHGTPDARLSDMGRLGALADSGRLQGAFGSFRESFLATRQQTYVSIHFWLYPLACLPARLFLDAVGFNPLAAAQVTNALLFSLAVAVVAFSPLPPPARWTLLGLFLFSPALWLVRWPHPEVYSASLALVALAAAMAGAWTLAALAASLASAQNPPLLLLLVVLLAPGLRAALPRGKAAVVGLALAVLPAVLPFAWSQWAFGTPSVLARDTTTPANVSLGRALELVVDLNIGLLPWMPLVVAAAAAASLRAAARRRAVLVGVGGWALLLAMAVLCTPTHNWNHGTFGPSRYAVWLVPLLIVMAVQPLREERPPVGLLALAAAAVAVQAAIVLGRGGLPARMDHLEHSPPARVVLDRWPSLYNPSFEVFSERTRHREVPWDDGPSVYRVGGGCRKVLMQRRHAAEVRAACGADPRGLDPFMARMRGAGRETWAYLEF
jgi:hypothetical protein